MPDTKKILFVLLVIGMIAMIQQNSFKKEGKLGARCSEDSKSIEIFNKNTEAGVTLQDCEEGECQLIDDMPQCIAKSETAKEIESKFAYLPYLLIAGIIFVIFIYKNKKEVKQNGK